MFKNYFKIVKEQTSDTPFSYCSSLDLLSSYIDEFHWMNYNSIPVLIFKWKVDFVFKELLK